MDKARSIGWKMGILIGLASVALNYASAQSLHHHSLLGFGLCLAGLIIMTPVLYGVTGLTYARHAGGAVGFKKIFSVLLLAILVSSAISFCWSIFYLKFIDPGFSAAYRETKIEYMKMMHTAPDIIKQEITEMQRAGKSNVSFISQAIFFGELIIAKAVVGAISALLLMRAPMTSGN